MSRLDDRLHDLVDSQVPSLAGRERDELTDYVRQLLTTFVPHRRLVLWLAETCPSRP
jgi:hypothetical protein